MPLLERDVPAVLRLRSGGEPRRLGTRLAMWLCIINGSPVTYQLSLPAKFLTYLSVVSEVILTRKANTSGS